MPIQTTHPAAQRFYVGAKTIMGKFTVGATGAVGTIDMPGVASITRGSTAGEYTIVLMDNWYKLKGFSANMLSTTGMDVYAQLTSEAVKASKTLVLQWYANGGTTETDPPAGEMFLSFDVTDSDIA